MGIDSQGWRGVLPGIPCRRDGDNNTRQATGARERVGFQDSGCVLPRILVWTGHRRKGRDGHWVS